MLNSSSRLFVLLGTLLAVAIALSLALGPVSINLQDLMMVLARSVGFDVISTPALEQAQLIVSQIRLPRALLGLAVGAVLALSGVAIQGLFRNPLADPGLIGVSSGAALGAAVAIVGGAMFGGISDAWSPYILSICAFAGGLGVTALVYRLGRRWTDSCSHYAIGRDCLGSVGWCRDWFIYLFSR